MTINSKDVLCTNATGANTRSTILNAFVTTLNASAVSEFAEITWANSSNTHLQGTADTAGKPFTASIAISTAGDGTMGAFAVSTANKGPYSANTADNWSTDAMPTNTCDVVFENSDVPCLYDLDILSGIKPTSMTVKQSYTGTIGLPRMNEDAGTGVGSEYVEYRERYFQIGPTTVTLGEGEGTGSGRLMFDFGTDDAAITIHNKGSREETGIPSALLKGTNTSNALTILRGDAGVAFFDGESADLTGGCKVGYKSSVLGDSELVCGSGTTFGNIEQSGGKVSIQSNLTTYTQEDGETYVDGSATITTAVIGGKMVDRSTGTWTTATVRDGGVYDRRETLAAKTITNVTLHKGASWHDPAGVVTLSNGWDFSQCSVADMTAFQTAKNKTLTESAI